MCVFYVSAKEATRQRWGYLRCFCRSCASNQASYPVLSFILNLILGQPQSPSLQGQRCLSSPHRPVSLPLKGLTESSKEREGSLHGTAWGTSSSLQTVPLMSCFNVWETTFISSLFNSLPTPSQGHSLPPPTVWAEAAFKLELPKKEKRKKEKAISLLQQAYCQ